MAFELGEVSGALILHDAFNGVINKAGVSLGDFGDRLKTALLDTGVFSKSSIASFEAVGSAVGIAVGALIALDGAIFALASRGADIKDVQGAFDHFSGSSVKAQDSMDALRKGTQNTVDDFFLMQEATRVLSAGVRATSSDFDTMASAAFVLQNRGLGPTDEMLKMIADTMVTGRTRTLAMKLGVIDLGDAHQNFADQLGVEVSMLSDAGKAEANRVQVMKMLAAAVKDAGAQEKDFGEKIDTVITIAKNWTDQLAVAVTQSSVLTVGMDTLGDAVSEAFSSQNSQLIDTVVDALEEVMIFTTNVGIATVEAARIIHTGWSGIKTLVLGVETAFVGLGAAIATTVSDILEIGAGLPLATDSMKAAAVSSREFSDGLQAMTLSLAEQTAEATRGITQQSEFDKTLDKIGGTLYRVRDAMVSANATTKTASEEVQKHVEVQDRAAESGARTTTNMIDQAKAAEHQAKALATANGIWQEYNRLLAEHSGTAMNSAIAKSEEWTQKTIAAAKAAKTDTEDFYRAVEAMSKEMVRSEAIDWDTIRKNRIATLVESAEKAKATYDEMKKSTNDYTNTSLQAQLDKYNDILRAIEKQDLAQLEANENSKEHFDKLARDAERAFQFASSHSDSFTSKHIDGLRQAAQTARETANQFGVSYTDNFVIIGQQAANTGRAVADSFTNAANQAVSAANQTRMSWMDAMRAVAEGQGTMTATIQGGPIDRAATQRAYETGQYYGPVIGGSRGNPRGTGIDWAAIGARAEGGPVSRDMPYIVGEHRPELFVPDRSGMIVPQVGGGTTHINVDVKISGIVDASLGHKITDIVRAELSNDMNISRRWPSS